MNVTFDSSHVEQESLLVRPNLSSSGSSRTKEGESIEYFYKYGHKLCKNNFIYIKS